MEIDNLLQKIPNKYILTVVISKRARQIFEEFKVLKSFTKDPLILAMEDIIKERIYYKEESEVED